MLGSIFTFRKRSRLNCQEEADHKIDVADMASKSQLLILRCQPLSSSAEEAGGFRALHKGITLILLVVVVVVVIVRQKLAFCFPPRLMLSYQGM